MFTKVASAVMAISFVAQPGGCTAEPEADGRVLIDCLTEGKKQVTFKAPTVAGKSAYTCGGGFCEYSWVTPRPDKSSSAVKHVGTAKKPKWVKVPKNATKLKQKQCNGWYVKK